MVLRPGFGPGSLAPLDLVLSEFRAHARPETRIEANSLSILVGGHDSSGSLRKG